MIFFTKILDKTVSLPKSNVISELTVSKYQFLKEIFNLLHKDTNLILEGLSDFKNNLLSIIFQILTNCENLCGKALEADKDFMRMKGLNMLFEIIQKEDSE